MSAHTLFYSSSFSRCEMNYLHGQKVRTTFFALKLFCLPVTVYDSAPQNGLGWKQPLRMVPVLLRVRLSAAA